MIKRIKHLLPVMAILMFYTNLFAADRMIGNIFYEGADENLTILVEKNSNYFYLIKTKKDRQEIVDSFSVLTGKYPEAKEKINDKKTPEGVYFITSYLSPEHMNKLYGEYSKTYGNGAYPINYPNPVDKIKNKTGYGIWIHGLNPERHKPTTDGCVGLENIYLDRVKPLLKLEMPVVIVDKISFLDNVSYADKKNEYVSTIDSFMDLWRSGNYKKMADYIHPKYKSYSFKSKDNYIKNKQHIMQRYDKRHIDIDDLSIYVQNDQTLLFQFDQLYCADNIVSYGNKKLYFDSGLLISEEMKPLLADTVMIPYIKDFLNNWIEFWSSKDLQNYSKLYSKSFPKLKGWLKHKKNVFEKAQSIGVKIDNIKIKHKTANAYEVTFDQTYTAENNNGKVYDKGIKTLTIKGCPGDFTITSEDWRAL